MGLPGFIILPVRAARELWRRGQRRARTNPLYAWRYTGTSADGLTMAPQHLRPADDRLAHDYYSGIYDFAGQSLTTGGKSPFAANPPSPEWFAHLHSFRWLNHLHAANTNLAQAHSNALVADWISLWGGELSSRAWRSEIVAARQISWLAHAPLLMRNTSDETYQIFLKSLTRQMRVMQHNMRYTRDGAPRLLVAIALAYSSLCLKGREKTIRPMAQTLDREITRQILPDGGHISRNPVVLLELLTDLMPLRQAYARQGHSPSPILLSAIDQMMAALRFFTHSSGQLAQFNGTGETPRTLLATILRHNEERGHPQSSAPQSGYERLAAGNTVVLMDVGKPLSPGTSEQALAGTLSFELSSGAHRFIANCGVPETLVDDYAPFTRATAAHSTLVVNDASSGRFAGGRALHRFMPATLIAPPDMVTSTRTEPLSLTASHTGYQPVYGVTHERSLTLTENGSALNGIDRMIGDPSQRSASPHNVAIRFHLPADISASFLSSGHSILLAALKGDKGSEKEADAWTFTCVDGEIALEESMQFSGPGQPRKTRQIVIYTTTRTDEVRWTFMRRPPHRKPQRKAAQEDEALPNLLVNDDGDTLP
ncbi:MAG: heparinase II/III family protein [Pseudomonadota bacterium]